MPETRYLEEYRSDGKGGSTLVKRTPYTVSDEEVSREKAPERLRALRADLAAWRNDPAALSLPTVSERLAKMAGAVLDLIDELAL